MKNVTVVMLATPRRFSVTASLMWMYSFSEVVNGEAPTYGLYFEKGISTDMQPLGLRTGGGG